MSAELTALQTHTKTLLDAAAYFADLVVVELSDGTIEAKIRQALATRGLQTVDGAKTIKPGLAIIVGIHEAEVTGVSPKLRVHPLVRCAVLENPLINRSTDGSNKLALNVCVEVARALNDQPALAGKSREAATTLFAPLKPCCQLLTEDLKRALYGFQGGLGWHANFGVKNGVAL